LEKHEIIVDETKHVGIYLCTIWRTETEMDTEMQKEKETMSGPGLSSQSNLTLRVIGYKVESLKMSASLSIRLVGRMVLSMYWSIAQVLTVLR